MSRQSISVTTVVGLILASSPLVADTLHVAADAYTSVAAPGQNNGGAPALFVRSAGPGGARRTFLRFDLAPLHSATTVSHATLRIWVAGVENPGSVGVRLVTGSWHEGGITAASEPAFGATVGTRGIGLGDAQSFVTVDVTSAVNDWLSGAIPNHGVALLASSGSVRVTFDSKENTGTSHPSEIETVSDGDIASVSAGAGLMGGGTSGDVALSLRSDCPVGRILKWNGANWLCAVDQVGSGGTVTNVDTATGLTGGPITGSGTLSLDTTFTDGRYLRRGGTTLNVNCTGSPTPGSFPSIAAALGAAAGFDGGVNIIVMGMCEEQVRFRRSATSLEGATPADGIRRPPSANAALIVSGVREASFNRLTLDGNGGGTALLVMNGTRIEEQFELTLQNAQTGLFVEGGSSLCLIDSAIRNNLGDGAVGDGLCLVNTPVTGNGGNGVSGGSVHIGFSTIVEDNGGVGVSGSGLIRGTIRNNGGGGLSCAGGAVFIDASARIADHPAAEGITAWGGCKVEVSGTVENNRTGVHLSLGSILSLSGNALIRNNSEDGVTLRDTSLLTPWNVPPGSMPRVTGNGGFGVRCDPPPAVAQVAFKFGAAIEVQGNGLGQSSCPMNCQGIDCPIVP